MNRTDRPSIFRGTRWWRWLPAVLWMAIIFILSARSGDQLDGWLPSFRELIPGLESFDPMHIVAYFLLALTFAYAIGPGFRLWRGKVFVLLASVLYGVTDEWHQAYVPRRTPDLADLGFDFIGAAVAVLVLSLWQLRRRHFRGRGNN